MPNLTVTNTDQITNDTINVVFYTAAAPNEVTEDFVSIAMKKDFFVPPDGCTVVIETDSPAKYTSYIQRGNRIDIYLNGNINLKAFIFDIKFEYDRTHTKLTLECKDLLEFMAQGSVPPNGNTGSLVSFHFPPDSTLKDCIKGIAPVGNNPGRLGLIGMFLLGLQNTTDGSLPTSLDVVYGDNNPTAGTIIGPLTIATGFAAGIRVAGKSSKTFTKSVNKALGRLNQPEKGESYLHMIERLIKLSGGNIKMAPGSVDTIVIQSPTYDRDTDPLYQITHYLSGEKTSLNNVLGPTTLHFSFDKIHSVIIVEGNSLDENEFHLTDDKAVAINELSAYDLVSKDDFKAGVIGLKPTVTNFITQMTAFNTDKIITTVPPLGSNYQFTPFNKQLYQQRYNIGVDINTSMCQPRYEVSHSAHSTDQLAFEAAVLLAEEQDKSLQFTYRLQGWSYQGAVWQPNQLVTVIEEALSPGNPLKLTLWIKEVTYHKDRHSGTYVEVVCTLPYTHNWEISDVPANVIPPHTDTGPYANIPTEKLIRNSINATQSQISNQNNMFHSSSDITPGVE